MSSFSFKPVIFSLEDRTCLDGSDPGGTILLPPPPPPPPPTTPVVIKLPIVGGLNSIAPITLTVNI